MGRQQQHKGRKLNKKKNERAGNENGNAAATQVQAGGKMKGKSKMSYKGKGKGKGKGGYYHYYYGDYYYDYITLKVTNLSFLQPFGAFFVAIHNEHAPPLFTLGSPATPELARLAEDGKSTL